MYILIVKHYLRFKLNYKKIYITIKPHFINAIMLTQIELFIFIYIFKNFVYVARYILVIYFF